MTGDIVAFIRARLDEDEFADWHHRRCQTHRIMPLGSPMGLAGSPLSCNCGVPDRVLRGVEAKRRMLDEFELCQACLVGERCVPHDASAGQPGISCIASAQHEWFARLLASEWSTHPDYWTEWTP